MVAAMRVGYDLVCGGLVLVVWAYVSMIADWVLSRCCWSCVAMVGVWWPWVCAVIQSASCEQRLACEWRRLSSVARGSAVRPFRYSLVWWFIRCDSLNLTLWISFPPRPEMAFDCVSSASVYSQMACSSTDANSSHHLVVCPFSRNHSKLSFCNLSFSSSLWKPHKYACHKRMPCLI